MEMLVSIHDAIRFFVRAFGTVTSDRRFARLSSLFYGPI
jgi:hypothetical protein